MVHRTAALTGLCMTQLLRPCPGGREGNDEGCMRICIGARPAVRAALRGRVCLDSWGGRSKPAGPIRHRLQDLVALLKGRATAHRQVLVMQ